MRAMVMYRHGESLRLQDMPQPCASAAELLLRVRACGVCRTDLHVLDGELPHPALPLIPGHQIVAEVIGKGSAVTRFTVGDRVGVPWLAGSCGSCAYCLSGAENLCDDALYTGYQINGGFAEFCVADARYCFPIPDGFEDAQAAPLLCAGLIGYRAWRPVRDERCIGLYGFGAAAHILIQVARHHRQSVFAFTRRGDSAAQALARDLGADWVGDAGERAPREMDAALIFAPAGELVPAALGAVRKGGRVICAGIHMSDIPSFPYRLLWGERHVESVANLTRRDGEEFLPLAASLPIRTEVHRYTLENAGVALDDLRAGRFTGAAVVIP